MTLTHMNRPAQESDVIEALQAQVGIKASKTQEAWKTPTLINSWVGNWYNAYGVPQYFKDEFGFVHIRGSLSGGESGGVAFTMPPGYIPPFGVAFTCPGVGTASGTVEITTDGDVRIILSGAGLTISCISYKVGD